MDNYGKREYKVNIKHCKKLFNKYYDENIEKIKKYCYFKLSDYPDYAEDCVQDTFRVLYEELLKGKSFKYITAFLVKTAGNFVNLKLRDIDKQKNKNISIEGNELELLYEQNFFNDVPDELILKYKDEIISSLEEEEQILLGKTCKYLNDSYRTTKQLAVEYSCSKTNIRQKIYVLRNRIKAIAKEKTKNL